MLEDLFIGPVMRLEDLWQPMYDPVREHPPDGQALTETRSRVVQGSRGRASYTPEGAM